MLKHQVNEQESSECIGKYMQNLHERATGREYSTHRYCSNNAIAIEIDNELGKYADNYGTFSNERYNEYFNAIGCNANDKYGPILLANPELSATQCEIEAAKNRLAQKNKVISLVLATKQ